MGPFDDLTEVQRQQIREAHAANKEREMRGREWFETGPEAPRPETLRLRAAVARLNERLTEQPDSKSKHREERGKTMTLGYTENGTIASYARGVEPPGGYAHTAPGKDCSEGNGGDVLARLWEAADDYEADTISEVARRAGILWQCMRDHGGSECRWDNREDETHCGGCGKEREPYCNHDAPAVADGVCECGNVIAAPDDIACGQADETP